MFTNQAYKYSHYLALFTYLVISILNVGCQTTSESGNAENASDTLTASLADIQNEDASSRALKVLTGAEVLISEKLDLLQDKRIAIIANPTSQMPDGTHLVDTLLSLGINIIKVFGPEHGFRGNASAGAKVSNDVDEKTGLPIISLYGKNRKPQAAQLEDIDIVIFDIQDVGSRHYTYIYTMAYAIEACAENNKSILVLDRPNPNGWYVDGPVLNKKHSSFIGMHEIPIVHGMTVGEYARMVNGEGWLKNGVQADLQVINCANYNHSMKWKDTGMEWIAPSPNLATEYAAYLYPAICWLEPTDASVGRGTDEAFTIVGAPWFSGLQNARTAGTGLELYGLQMESYSFTPRSLPGKSEHPKFQDKDCQGLKFKNRVDGKELFLAGISIIQTLYQQGSENGDFFRKSFARWPGNDSFKGQITNGETPEDIYQSWQEDVTAFKAIRSKYLLYDDF